jgi:hypothetical protein
MNPTLHRSGSPSKKDSPRDVLPAHVAILGSVGCPSAEAPGPPDPSNDTRDLRPASKINPPPAFGSPSALALQPIRLATDRPESLNEMPLKPQPNCQRSTGSDDRWVVFPVCQIDRGRIPQPAARFRAGVKPAPGPFDPATTALALGTLEYSGPPPSCQRAEGLSKKIFPAAVATGPLGGQRQSSYIGRPPASNPATTRNSLRCSPFVSPRPEVIIALVSCSARRYRFFSPLSRLRTP